MPTKTKKKIRYGKKDVLTASDFKNPKIRITMMVDEDIVRAFKERAEESGEGYQTLMNRALRETMMKPSVEQRISELERLVKAG
jgi:uncharacterized protein (DUF4415 family)